MDFKYLTEDGLLQRTRFSDGTIIVANFGEKTITWNDKNIAPMALITILPDGKLMSFDTNMKPQ